MKATGIVRRIDDLGRVVIPKEIRRTLRIREGDPLEIFTEQNGGIVLKKYSPIGDLSTFAAQYADGLASASKSLVCVTDRDHIIAAAGNGKKNYEGKPISQNLEQLIENRGCQVTDSQDKGCCKLTLDDTTKIQFTEVRAEKPKNPPERLANPPERIH